MALRDSRTVRGWVGTLAVCGSILAGSVLISRAGPLDPPAGPVSPTYRTLSEVEPRIPIGPSTTPGDADSVYKITQPGTYYLTENLTGKSGKHGIEIAASYVTIDLRGFNLVGVAGSLDALSGVNVTALTIGNGVIRSWPGRGIGMPTASSSTFHHLDVFDCAGFGIDVGVRCRVEACNCRNGSEGVRSGDECTISSCTVVSCSGTGLIGGKGSEIRGCSVSFPGSYGIYGGIGSRVIDCSVRSGTSTGIIVSDSSIVRGCTSVGNGSGISLFGIGSKAEDCTANQNQYEGITTSLYVGGFVISHCAASSNGTYGIVGNSSDITGCSAGGNGVDGIVANGGSVTDCTSTGNTQAGIRGADAMISRCSADSNTLDGFVVSSYCTIESCHADLNGLDAGIGAGILATGIGNRIENNQVVRNDYGLHITGDNNVIIRNTARGNTTNYSIIAGNENAAVLTNPGANFTSTNPWANIAF